MSIKVNFLGQTKVEDTDNEQVKKIKTQWNQFAGLMIFLVAVKIGLDAFALSNYGL